MTCVATHATATRRRGAPASDAARPAAAMATATAVAVGVAGS